MRVVGVFGILTAIGCGRVGFDPLGDARGVGTYVSEAIGDDAAPGTSARPARTISRGIANAEASGATVVYVAEGSYPEKVEMVEGISLLGGHACSPGACTWARDVSRYDTAIFDQDFEGVLVPREVTRATRLDGFRVVGLAGDPLAGPGGATITVEGAATISTNRVIGAALTSPGPDRGSFAIAILEPSPANGPLVSGNFITLGSAPVLAAGVAFVSTSAAPTGAAFGEVRENTISGGTASMTAGVLASTSAPNTVIVANNIASGTATPGGGAWGIAGTGYAVIDANRINTSPGIAGSCAMADWCGGIDSSSATMVITNNVIFGAPTARSAAIRLRQTQVVAQLVIIHSNFLDGGGMGTGISTAIQLETCASCTNATMGRIRNNILLYGANPSRYGVYENAGAGRTNHAAVIENNDFYAQGGGFAYRTWNGAASSDVTFAQLTQLATPVPSQNINADPMVDVTHHLSASSPCIDKGTSVEAPATDIDGNVRPKGSGFDIGADER